jgi:hypothetical protein
VRVIIAGGRNMAAKIGRKNVLRLIDEACFPTDLIDHVVSGAAAGVDLIGMQWARDRGIPIRTYIPDWETYGRAAGPLRNAKMAGNAEALILIWDGQSRGSASMLREARKRNLLIYECLITGSYNTRIWYRHSEIDVRYLAEIRSRGRQATPESMAANHARYRELFEREEN